MTFLKTAAIAAATSAFALTAQAETWNMQSLYPGSLPQLGTLGKKTAEDIGKVTGGAIEVQFQEPGALVPALEAFDAVSSGAVEAAWSSAGFWAGKEPALQLFASVPFGPAAPEYFAWYKFGGGQELLDEIYARNNLKSLPCATLAPEASGWFRKEINSPEDLKGLKMRFYGLGAQVMEKLGVSTQLLAPGDIFAALELGTIDATEFSMPALDLNLGFHQVAKHYYFPGWHQQSTIQELLMNKEVWDGLDETAQAQIKSVCDANLAYGLAEGEALQFDALQQIRDKGVTIHSWTPEMLDAFRGAWEEVVKEQVEADADFAKVWESLSKFRADYKQWRDIGYLD